MRGLREVAPMRDVAFGQYYPAESFVHKCDPRTKILFLIVYIAAIFTAKNFYGLAACAAVFVVVTACSRVPVKSVLRSVKAIIFLLLFTAVLNLFFYSGETVWVKWGFLKITKEGVFYTIFLSVRLFLLVMGSAILTLTTTPVSLTDGIESLLYPLKLIRFPVHELALIMSIALRFIPILTDETGRIMNAQKARGAQLDTGKMTDRVKALVPVLIPLFISAFRRADELAMAMECRCYRGGDGRTRLKVLRCTKQDYIDLAVCIACFAVILSSRLVFPNF